MKPKRSSGSVSFMTSRPRKNTSEFVSSFEDIDFDKESRIYDNLLVDNYKQIKNAVVELSKGNAEPASSREGDDNKMNNEKFSYLDQSYKNLREDIKEREERIIKDADNRERRFQEEMTRLRLESLEREERARIESKEREERMMKSLEQFEQRISGSFNEIKESSLRSESRIDDMAKHVQSMVTSNLWGRIATVIAILALCIATFFSVYTIINDKDSENNKQETPQTQNE